ncbi:MAG: DoxX family protein [Planctomycetota bacterium]|nr:DoxX family protein [Planctomycetota bacterium]
MKKADSWADQTQAWLTQGERSVDTPSPDGKDTGTLKQTLTTPERIIRHAKLAKALEDQVASRRNWDFSKDVDKATLASAKAALAKSRTELNEDIDRMETDLTKKLQAMAADVSVTPRQWRLSDIFTIKTIDVMSILAITAIGAGLFTGTLTRLAALGGAAFLLLTYLAVPPFPWLPTPPLNEGNYVFINKNFVEMMALLVLAATPSGRWFGLDAVIMPLFFRDSEKA